MVDRCVEYHRSLRLVKLSTSRRRRRKSPFVTPLICTGGHRNTATSSTNQSSRHRGFAPLSQGWERICYQSQSAGHQDCEFYLPSSSPKVYVNGEAARSGQLPGTTRPLGTNSVSTLESPGAGGSRTPAWMRRVATRRGLGRVGGMSGHIGTEGAPSICLAGMHTARNPERTAPQILA